MWVQKEAEARRNPRPIRSELLWRVSIVAASISPWISGRLDSLGEL
jgi:hypothetical protein